MHTRQPLVIKKASSQKRKSSMHGCSVCDWPGSYAGLTGVGLESMLRRSKADGLHDQLQGPPLDHEIAGKVCVCNKERAAGGLTS